MTQPADAVPEVERCDERRGRVDVTYVRKPSGCDTYGVLAAISASVVVTFSFSSGVLSPELRPLEGMDDEVVMGRLHRLFRQASWSWSFVGKLATPVDAHESLGVYEPVSTAFRLVVALLAGGVSIRSAIMASISLHALATFFACLLARDLLFRLAIGRSHCGSYYEDNAALDAFCAFASVAFLGAHPMRAEAICWLSSQGYLLACVFCLLCMLLHLRRGCFVIRLLQALLFCLGLLSKAAAAPLPAVLVLMDLAIESRGPQGTFSWSAFRYVLGRTMLLWPISFAGAVAAALAAGPVPADVRLLGWGESLLRACFAIWFYISRTFLPPFRWTTPRLRVPDLGQLVISEFRFCWPLITILICTLVGVLSATSLRRGPLLLLGWIAYFVAVLPSLGLVSGDHIWALAADRYAYIPSMWVLTVVNAGALRLAYVQILRSMGIRARGMLLSLSLSCVCILCIGMASQRATEVSMLWSGGSASLFRAILALDPADFSSWKDLGSMQLKHGALADARRSLAQALTLKPGHSGALLNFATLLHKTSRVEEAERFYHSARQASVSSTAACAARQRSAGLLAHQCLAERTELGKVEANYGALLVQAGRFEEAIAVQRPGDPWPGLPAPSRATNAYNLALAHRALNELGHAARLLRLASVLAPDISGGAAPKLWRREYRERRVIVEGVR